MVCDLSLLNLSTERKQWTLAAKTWGKWFRRVKEAAEQYLKRCFVEEKDTSVLGTEWQRKTPLDPRAGGGRERSRVDGWMRNNSI